jgi:serine/threonine protein phosphatase PrpC
LFDGDFRLIDLLAQGAQLLHALLFGLPLRPQLIRFEPGDRVLLCTKGLADVVPDDRLLRCVREHADAQKCAEALTALGLFHNSRDNISCMELAATAE